MTTELSLHKIAEQGDVEEMRLLLKTQTLSLDAKDSEGWTPLLYASERGHLEIVRLLLDYGASVHALSDFNESALMCAAEYGHYEVVLELLERGADATLFNLAGEDAYYLAGDNGYVAICALLERYGGKCRR